MNTTTTPAPRRRAYRGPAVLSYGFRPFFLLGAIYAGLAILVWLPIFHGELSLHSAFAPRDWHVQARSAPRSAAILAARPSSIARAS
jgi:uncharacterized protein involved in response to NO